MVFAAAEPKKDMLLIDRNVRWLEAKQVTEADRKGAWSYPGPGRRQQQLAVRRARALRSPERRREGQAADLAARGRLLAQHAERRRLLGLCAGRRGLGQHDLRRHRRARHVDRRARIGRRRRSRTAASSAAGRTRTTTRCERAIDWLAEHFSVSRNPRPAGAGQACLYYYLYGLERAGRLTARRFIGDHDWYREGAEFLVRDQDPLSHYWQGNWHAEQQPHISTALALLFLAKGRRPVVMAKLEYGEPEHWNQHRRDAANLAAYTEKAWDLGLTWQTVDAERATVEDLLQVAGALHQRQPGDRAAALRRTSSATTSTAAASSSPRPAAAIRTASTRASAN